MFIPFTLAAESAPITVVCFGDSITGHRPNTVYQGNYVKYSDMLGLMLEAKMGPDRVRVINSGWAGDKQLPSPVKDGLVHGRGWPAISLPTNRLLRPCSSVAITGRIPLKKSCN